MQYTKDMDYLSSVEPDAVCQTSRLPFPPVYLMSTGKATSEWWGRITFFVNDVDEFYSQVVSKGLRPENEPQDTQYAERFFVIVDTDGHELWYVSASGEGAWGRPGGKGGGGDGIVSAACVFTRLFHITT